MFRPLRWIASALSTLVGLYVFFFVPIGGPRTLWDHTRRIMGTPEAQELGRDLHHAGEQVADRVQHEVVPTLLTWGDAGVDGSARSPRPR